MDEGFFVESDYDAANQDIIGPSQLPDALVDQTQDIGFSTPAARLWRPIHPPDALTYSADHVRARGRGRRAKRARGAASRE